MLVDRAAISTGAKWLKRGSRFHRGDPEKVSSGGECSGIDGNDTGICKNMGGAMPKRRVKVSYLYMAQVIDYGVHYNVPYKPLTTGNLTDQVAAL